MSTNEPVKKTPPLTAEEKRLADNRRLERAITPTSGVSRGRREFYAPQPSDVQLQPCDFKKWLKYDSLPIERACFVLLGFEPPPLDVLMSVYDKYNLSRERTWDRPPGYDDVLASLHSSIAHDNISVLRITEYPYDTKQATWPDLVRWAKSKDYPIAPELETLVAKMEPASVGGAVTVTAPVVVTGTPAPAPDTATPAPVVTAEAVKSKATGARLATSMGALIAQHKHEWPTIERDIKDASKNGLSMAAKAGARDWNESDAVQWARSRNKLTQVNQPASLPNLMSNLTGIKHRLDD